MQIIVPDLLVSVGLNLSRHFPCISKLPSTVDLFLMFVWILQKITACSWVLHRSVIIATIFLN